MKKELLVLMNVSNLPSIINNRVAVDGYSLFRIETPNGHVLSVHDHIQDKQVKGYPYTTVGFVEAIRNYFNINEMEYLRTEIIPTDVVIWVMTEKEMDFSNLPVETDPLDELDRTFSYLQSKLNRM